MDRRAFIVTGCLAISVLSLPSALAAGADEDALWIKLRTEPHLVVFMRHSHSAGGNPTSWDESGQCRGESVLTEDGKAHARKIARAFAQHGVTPIKVISSPMCRCRETALIAFGSGYVTDPVLREIATADSARTAAYEKAAVALIAANLGNAPVLFVSHRPNINLLTSELIEEGDLLIGRASQSGEIDVIGKMRIEP
jgi:phosphohistidine phosphatase SixA